MWDLDNSTKSVSTSNLSLIKHYSILRIKIIHSIKLPTQLPPAPHQDPFTLLGVGTKEVLRSILIQLDQRAGVHRFFETVGTNTEKLSLFDINVKNFP